MNVAEEQVDVLLTAVALAVAGRPRGDVKMESKIKWGRVLLAVAFLTACERNHNGRSKFGPPPPTQGEVTEKTKSDTDAEKDKDNKKEEQAKKDEEDKNEEQAKNEKDAKNEKTEDKEQPKDLAQTLPPPNPQGPTQDQQPPSQTQPPQDLAQSPEPPPSSSEQDQAQRQEQPPTQEKQDQKEDVAKGKDQERANSGPAMAQLNVPTIPEPPKTIAAAIDASDRLLSLLIEYLSSPDSSKIDSNASALLDEMFENEAEKEGKVVELQVNIGKLSHTGLYTPQVKERVALLQTQLDDRVRLHDQWDMLGKGLYFVAGGVVVGSIAGWGVPALGAVTRDGIRNGWSSAKSGMYSGMNTGYNMSVKGLQSGYGMLKSGSGSAYRYARTNFTRQNFIDSKNAAFQAGTNFRNRVTGFWHQPITPSQIMLNNNLNELGLTMTQRNVLGQIYEVPRMVIPAGLRFEKTPRPTLEYAILDRSPDLASTPLGAKRVFAFKQGRWIRGSRFETIYVSQPMNAQSAKFIADKFKVRNAQPTEGQTVHFLNLKNGAVTALQVSADTFKSIANGTGRMIKPLFTNFDVPTAVGTGVVTTTLLAVAHSYGYDSGHFQTEQQVDLELEKFVTDESNSKPGRE